MKTTFVDADSGYRAKLEATGDLDSAFAAACAVGKVDLCGTDITRAVLARMESYFKVQESIKAVLGKGYGAAASDFFVETVAFYLKVVVNIQKLNLRVASEQPVNQAVVRFLKIVAKVQDLQPSAAPRGAVVPVPSERIMRPDISIWRCDEDELVAAIECKTQLGRNRNGWLQEFEKEESRLKQQRPHAKLVLLAMTEQNWGGFGDDPRRGRQFFALLDAKHHKNRWPDLSAPTITGLAHPIERLFHFVLS